jgi:ribosomal protein S18 acetylase RimI-like enzyme
MTIHLDETDSKITYCKASINDIDYLLWLRKKTMNEYIIKSGKVINERMHLDRIYYHFDDARIIYLNDRRIGLLKATEHQDYIEIIQIQIEPKYQGKGIGENLIKSIIQKASTNKSYVMLSVLKENKAKKLYERIGFHMVEENENSFIMKYTM